MSGEGRSSGQGAIFIEKPAPAACVPVLNRTYTGLRSMFETGLRGARGASADDWTLGITIDMRVRVAGGDATSHNQVTREGHSSSSAPTPRQHMKSFFICPLTTSGSETGDESDSQHVTWK